MHALSLQHRFGQSRQKGINIYIMVAIMGKRLTTILILFLAQFSSAGYVHVLNIEMDDCCKQLVHFDSRTLVFDRNNIVGHVFTDCFNIGNQLMKVKLLGTTRLCGMLLKDERRSCHGRSRRRRVEL
jgi:hypothetical protein